MNTEEFNFETLKCWQVGTEIRREISALVETFPIEEKYRLTDQLIRSTRSATATIAEGFGRYHLADSIRFYYMSRGSMSETLDHLIAASDAGLITSEQLLYYRSQIRSFHQLLNGFIKHQQALKNKLK